MANEFIARNGITSLGNIVVSGSLTTTGAITISGSIASASFATSAATASSADNLLVRSTLTAQTLVVQTITSSIDFVTGSTQFGSLLSNTHVFSGSVTMNPGGLFVSSSGNVGIGNINPLSKLDITVLAGGARRLLVNYDDSLVTIKSANASATAESLRVWGDNIYFYTGSAGSELMRLTNTGRVGIGTTAPSASLHVNGTVEANGSLYRAVFGGTAQNANMTGLSGGNGSELQIQAGSSTRGAFLTLGGGMATSEAMGGVAFYNSNNTDGKRLRAYLVGGQEGATTNEQGGYLTFGTAANAATTPTERMRITSGGQLCLTATAPKDPSNYGAARTFLTVQAKTGAADRGAYLELIGTGGGNPNYWNGAVAFSNTNSTYYTAQIYSLTDTGGNYSGNLIFSTNANASTGADTERMRITSGGNTEIRSGNILNIYRTDNTRALQLYTTSNECVIDSWEASSEPLMIRSNGSGGRIVFHTNAAERMRITSGGGIGIGTTSVTGTYKCRIINSSAVNGDPLFAVDNNIYNGILVYSAGADGYNGAATVMVMGRNTSTSRSINAGGTINASGADYAEYMTKAIDDTIEKGDIVGVDANGLLTNIFADAKSFVVKSTDPSYVGGDTWGNVDDIGKLPLEPTEEEISKHNAKLEEARAKVDRIAFSGQVPCNVTGANVGDYIIPIELENGKIGGQAITNPTFEQYQISVGKVWKIMEDGRAWIAVKIG